MRKRCSKERTFVDVLSCQTWRHRRRRRVYNVINAPTINKRKQQYEYRLLRVPFARRTQGGHRAIHRGARYRSSVVSVAVVAFPRTDPESGRRTSPASPTRRVVRVCAERERDSRPACRPERPAADRPMITRYTFARVFRRGLARYVRHAKQYRCAPASFCYAPRTASRADNRFFIVATGSGTYAYYYTLCTYVFISQLPGTPIPIDTHLKTLYRIIRRDRVRAV